MDRWLSMMLPAADPAFRWTAEGWGSALRCQPLLGIAQHAFTSKQLQLRPGGPTAQPTAWTQAAASVGGGIEQLMLVKQVHGATVRVLEQGATTPQDVAERPEADAMVSNSPGLILAVQVADCVPILMADSRTGVAAAVHAGWRGTSARVAGVAVETMVREFGTDAAELTVAMGPSIGVCCYEVGPSLIEAFRQSGATDAEVAHWFQRTADGALHLDLWAANRDQLLSAGVRADHLFISGLCTRTHRKVFESYRAEGEAAGRMAALIRVPTR